MAFDRAVLYRNDAFLILVLSTNKWCSNFLNKVFLFQKICFTALKTFKIFSNGRLKACESLKRKAILKVSGAVL